MHVVRLPEEAKQDELKPEAARQYGIYLDSKLTVTTKRRHVSSLPRNVEELRKKHLLAQAIPARTWQCGNWSARCELFDFFVGSVVSFSV